MTSQKKFKRRVRERMAETGETYMQARQQLDQHTAVRQEVRIVTTRRHEDEDDVLAAVAAEYVAAYPDLRGWDLDPRWDGGDAGDRRAVLLSVPTWAAGGT